MTRERILAALFLIAGLINFVPLAGVLGDATLSAAYGIEIASNELSLLLRHRAVLFGIIGGLLLCAAARPALRTTAGICGMTSMIGFALLYSLTGAANEELAGVLRIDLIGIAVLGIAMTLNVKEKAAP